MTLKNETIVDRVVARLKAQPLGDLITEEDLHDIVKQAIPKTFFEKRMIPTEDRWQPTREAPPLIVEVMQGLLKESAKKAVEDWLVKNAEIVEEYWVKVMDQNLLAYVQGLQDQMATAQVRRSLNGLVSSLNEDRQKMGLPTLHLFG